MPDRPLIIFVASYADIAGAEADYDAVRALHKAGDLGHVAAAIVIKGTDGKLKIHRHDTTAKHLAWGGALAGGLIGVLVPPLGFAWPSTGSSWPGPAVSSATTGTTSRRPTYRR
jgi:uncharacterized membrane protein